MSDQDGGDFSGTATYKLESEAAAFCGSAEVNDGTFGLQVSTSMQTNNCGASGPVTAGGSFTMDVGVSRDEFMQ